MGLKVDTPACVMCRGPVLGQSDMCAECYSAIDEQNDLRRREFRRHQIRLQDHWRGEEAEEETPDA